MEAIICTIDGMAMISTHNKQLGMITADGPGRMLLLSTLADSPVLVRNYSSNQQTEQVSLQFCTEQIFTHFY